MGFLPTKAKALPTITNALKRFLIAPSTPNQISSQLHHLDNFFNQFLVLSIAVLPINKALPNASRNPIIISIVFSTLRWNQDS